MLLSELILELQDKLEEFGDLTCEFNRSLNNILDSWTKNATIYVSYEEDLHEGYVLKIEGH